MLLVTVVFAAGALFAKFNLEAFRARVEASLENHMGASLNLGAVSVNGLRGLRLENLTLEVESEGGPRAALTAPVALVDINLTNLLYGAITVDQIVLNGASLVIERPEDAIWYSADGFDLHDLLDLPPSHGFRITGEDGRVEIRNVVGGTRAEITGFRFDIARLVNATDMSATLHGNLWGDPEKDVRVRLTMASFQDFDLRVESGLLTASDVNVFLPAERHIVESGVARPTLWIGGRPDDTLLVSLNASFEQIAIRDQPDFLDPADGALTIHATYATNTHRLSVTTAKAVSQELTGALEGSVSFANTYPEFDLRLRATRLPVIQLLDYVLDGQIDDYGDTELVLNEPHELVIALNGSSEEPILTGQVSAGSGEFILAPAGKNEPRVSLTLGAMEARWDSHEQKMTGRFNVVNGEAVHPPTRVTVTNLNGLVTIEDKQLAVGPLTGQITGNPVMAELAYNIETGNGEAIVSGTIPNIEETAIHDTIKHTRLAGSIDVARAKILKTGGRYTIDAELDATQTRVDHSWWFSKPAGIGARGTVNVEFAPQKSLVIDASAEVASSQLKATTALNYTKDPDQLWIMNWARASSSHLDVTSLGRCLSIPYRVTGGTGVDAEFYWERNFQEDDAWSETMRAQFDDVSILPAAEGDPVPMNARDLRVEATITKDANAIGTINLHTASAVMPALSDPWFVPAETVTPWGEVIPSVDRDWSYVLAADALVLPPWRGTEFTAEAYQDPKTSGFKSYKANIDGGQIEGSYHLTRAENAYTSTVTWDAVPAHYLLAHLNWPAVLAGPLSGTIAYSLDRDDPNTLQGEGLFTIHDGQFSADYLASLIEGQGGELTVLPPSLRFQEVSARVQLDRDIIRTPEVKLISDGIRMNGEGQYVQNGDMDYRIRVAVTPATAERIPVLAENLNIQGHRLSQQDIELGFRIEGPTFNPQGQLEQLPPVGVTLVSGAIGVTSQVIDFPRRILVDLLKMGGGIVGGR